MGNVGDDRFSQWVFGFQFGRADDGTVWILLRSYCDPLRNGRTSFGQCSRLVHDERVNPAHLFESRGILDQDFILGPSSDADHQGGRSG